jgi:hypothetical protein
LDRRRPVTIHRAFDGESVLLEHLRVDLRGAYVLVPEQFLDGADVGSIGQQVSGKGISKRVANGVLLDFQLSNGGANRFLEIRRIEVVSSTDAAKGID